MQCPLSCLLLCRMFQHRHRYTVLGHYTRHSFLHTDVMCRLFCLYCHPSAIRNLRLKTLLSPVSVLSNNLIFNLILRFMLPRQTSTYTIQAVCPKFLSPHAFVFYCFDAPHRTVYLFFKMSV